VKILEYSACGYPSLASPIGEYPELVQLGLPAMIVPDGEWKDALSLAINFKDGIPSRGREARKWVHKNRCVIQTRAQSWKDALAVICEKAGV
jgi:glycosyltransferase involved in cell wall biosynthesis